MSNLHDPHRLLPHPFNTKIYGVEQPDPDLVKSIREKGILDTVVVVSTTIDEQIGLYILSGHRRVRAAKQIGCKVPIQVLLDEGSLWQESRILEFNRQRVKTPEMMSREYTELNRIELALAEKRRSQGIKETVSASEKAAASVGVQAPWARKMEFIVQEADRGNPVAQQGLQEINARRATPESVYRKIQVKEEDSVRLHHKQVAARLESVVGLFDVEYAPRLAEPKHGFRFEKRFVCVEEAEAFINLLSKIPEAARDEFARQSASWRKR
jgi:ParB-like chromosome segregation protein Spo0J